MNRSLWVHQFDELVPAWGDPPYGPLVKNLGFTHICPKAMDGDTWMSEYDHNPDAIGSLQDCSDRLAAFNGAGLGMDLWVVPTKDTWQQALVQYQAIARSLPGRLFLDMEPYAGFWGDDSDASAFLNEMALPRVWLCYDVRRTDWLQTQLGRFEGSAPMLYLPDWTGSVIPNGRPCEPILDSTSSGQVWMTILRDPQLGSIDGRTGFGIFRAPIQGLERLATIRGMA